LTTARNYSASSDQSFDLNKWKRGAKINDSEVVLIDGTQHAQIRVATGPAGQSWCAQLKTPQQLAALMPEQFNQYIVTTFKSNDLTVEQLEDLRYYFQWRDT
jgi:hypothetical protein